MAKAAYSEFEFGNKNSFQTNLRKARKIAHRLLKTLWFWESILEDLQREFKKHAIAISLIFHVLVLLFLFNSAINIIFIFCLQDH